MKFTVTGMTLIMLELVSSHMEGIHPAPRHSKYLPGVQSDLIDYSMSAPLDGNRPFPCIGYGAGPIAETYKAGSTVSIDLMGTANHNGGHCQFSLSYDGKTFVGIKTIFGDCMVNQLKYDVTIPKDAPGGRAVFGWTWINRSGQREYYMNCADVNIIGNPKSTLTGHEIVIGNFDVPGKTNYQFPEGFSNDFGKQYFDQTPIYNISPSLSKLDPSNKNSIYKPPTPNVIPSTPQKPVASKTVGNTQSSFSSSTKVIRNGSSSSYQFTSSSTSYYSNGAPRPNNVNLPKPSLPNFIPATCQHGEMKCHNANSYSICNHNLLVIVPCAAALRCTNNGKVNCVP